MRSVIFGWIATGVLANLGCGSASAAEPCTGFKWDVTRELALFAGPATMMPAGKNPASAPTITVARLYELALAPQSDIAFTVAPGKRMLTDGAYAGMLQFKVTTSGSYRVSVDTPFWIDVVGAGQLVASKDFQGQQQCAAPHKIVEYELVAAQPYYLQMSAAARATVRLSITQSAAPKP